MIDWIALAIVGIAGGMMGWAGYGWVQLVTFGKGTWDEIVIRGVALLCVLLTFRLMIWGFVIPALRGEVRAVPINMVLDAITIVGAYYLLRGRYLLIPENQRAGWHWWNAPLYPPKRCVIPWAHLMWWIRK